MRGSLRSMTIAGFRSIAEATVPLGPLTVLVGPNGSGKSNVLNVLRLLNATIRFDLPTAIETFGGFEHVIRNDGTTEMIRIAVEAIVTEHANDNARDRYMLEVSQQPGGVLNRAEEFTFKRTRGQGRRITVNGSTVTFGAAKGRGKQLRLADEQTTGLATLPKLAPDQGGEGIDAFAEFVSAIRVLEPDVASARLPSRLYGADLAEDASNLSDALLRLRELSSQAFVDLQNDVGRCLPGLDTISFAAVGGGAQTVVVQLGERGLSNPIDLADASFGTVRLLSLLTMLHHPSPPPFIAIEEVDHGLHPYALDVLIDALRAASERSQILIATHSPTFVNRLIPPELVICDRDAESGASLIPAVDPSTLAEAADASALRLGELWFSGAVGGVPA